MSSESRAECHFCPHSPSFRLPFDFIDHLRRVHCSKEGGSYVCKFGPHGVCASLPIDGVSDRDYEEHVRRVHLPSYSRAGASGAAGSASSESSRAGSPLEGRWSKASSSRASLSSQPTAQPPSLLEDLGPKPFSSRTSTQNLSSVLSDPRKTRREVAAFFTRHHGSDFVERTHVPPRPGTKPLKPKHFFDYLTHIGKKQRRHERDVARLAETSRRREVAGREETDPAASLALYHRLLPSLPQLPALFLSSAFALTDPLTFAKVFLASPQPNPFGDDDQSPEPAHDNPFQEELEEESRLRSLRLRPAAELETELGGYLDAVETRIGLQIQARSGAFFKAMTSHDELQTHLAQTKGAVQRLRGKIAELDSRLVRPTARLHSLARARANRLAALARLQDMKEVAETQAHVQVLLNGYNFLAALDVIRSTQDRLKHSLAGVFAFRHLGLQLSEMESVIGKMLKAEFVDAVQAELRKDLLLERGEAVKEELDEVQLSSLVIAFLRLREFRFLAVVREEASAALKTLLKESVKGGLEPGDKVSEELRRLPWPDYVARLSRLGQLLHRFGRRLAALSAATQDLVDIAAGRTAPPSTPTSALPQPAHLHDSLAQDTRGLGLEESEHLLLSETLGEISVAVGALSQDLLLRVVSLRSKDGGLDKLRLEEVQELLQLCRSFVGENEEALGVVRGSSSVLVQGVHGLLGGWVEAFARQRKEKLAAILDSELWRAEAVPKVFQAILSAAESSGRLRDVLGGEAEKGTVEALEWGGERWVVVSTAVILVQMGAQYAGLAEEVPLLAADLLPRLVELLKAFNSRTCQLILGAGAMHTIHIKSISLRHLALAWRSLELVAATVPLLREDFQPRLPPSQANLARHFAQVEKDLRDHMGELYNKMVSVSEAYIAARLSRWEAAGTAPSQALQKMVRNIASVHEQIAPVLAPLAVQKVMLRIHALFKELWREKLLEAAVSPSDSARYGFVCAEWSAYLEALRKIPPLASLDDSLTSVYAGR